MKTRKIVLSGLPRMLEEMIVKIFENRSEVQVDVCPVEQLEKIQLNRYLHRSFDALLAVEPDSISRDEWARKTLIANPYGPVICLNENATGARIYELKVAMTEVEEVSVDSLPVLLDQCSIRYH